jgi:hypothetical protein
MKQKLNDGVFTVHPAENLPYVKISGYRETHPWGMKKILSNKGNLFKYKVQ